MVAGKEAECGFLLPDDVIGLMKGENPQKIEILRHPETTLDLMAREEVFESVFRRWAPVWLEDYLKNDEKFAGLTQEEAAGMVRGRYAYWLGSGETFHVIYEDVPEDFFRDDMAFRLPVRGLIALLLYVCAAAGISSLKRDIRTGRVILRRRRLFWELGAVYAGLALLIPAVFSLICLFSGGTAAFTAAIVSAEALRLALYCLCLIAFNTVLGAVTGEGYVFELLIPPIVIFCLLYSPAVFSFENYLPFYTVLTHFAPASWYLP